MIRKRQSKKTQILRSYDWPRAKKTHHLNEKAKITHYLNDFKASDWNESKKTHLGFPIVAGFFPYRGSKVASEGGQDLEGVQALKMGRRARRDGLCGAVMSEVSGDAARRFLACLFPGLIVAMTSACLPLGDT